MLTRRIVLSLVLVLTMVLGTMVLASEPPPYPNSSQGVIPVFYDTGPGGNVECSEVGTYEMASPRYDEGFQYAGTFETITWSTTDNKYVSWAGEHGGMAIIVKGGPGAHVYYYTLDPYYNYDSYLVSPTNPGGNIPDLSNITFCYNPPQEMGQWCSPGYWRQTQHLDSWIATGYSPDDLFFDVFGYYPPISKLGRTNGATTNPTLWDVLQAPQYYGAEAFNAIGDLLSAAHPDVNFLGERIEDSCPLN